MEKCKYLQRHEVPQLHTTVGVAAYICELGHEDCEDCEDYELQAPEVR